jgi:hypothetical protein
MGVAVIITIMSTGIRRHQHQGRAKRSEKLQTQIVDCHRETPGGLTIASEA